MEEERRSSSLGMGGGHVLALPYPSQGHINPMLHFCKRLVSNGLKATLAVTTFICNNTSVQYPISHSVQIETISDGYDEGGFMQASSIEAYLARLESAGSQTLTQLIQRYAASTSDVHPFDCVVYDAFLPWALDVTKQLGLVAASFFTQACSVNYIYHQVHHGLLTLPIPVSSLPLQSFPGLPFLQLHDMPSFIYFYGSYPAYFHLVKNQYRNAAHKADYVFVNTFYKLEDKVVDTMSKVVSPLLTIGPTIPSFYLDNRIENDRDYGLDLFPVDQSSTCSDWLSSKPKESVVYVSFGSMAGLAHQQMEELAWGIERSGYCFLWVVRASEEAKLPRKFTEETSEKGLVVQWSPQLEVLSSEAVGCFFSHCGWNSTMEALSLGVAMVVMPQWTDQTTNAKLVQDVWKVGLRVRVDEKGIVGREEIEASIREVMEGESGKEMKKNAEMWRELGREAVSEGGTSDINIRKFVSELTSSSGPSRSHVY